MQSVLEKYNLRYPECRTNKSYGMAMQLIRTLDDDATVAEAVAELIDNTWDFEDHTIALNAVSSAQRQYPKVQEVLVASVLERFSDRPQASLRKMFRAICSHGRVKNQSLEAMRMLVDAGAFRELDNITSKISKRLISLENHEIIRYVYEKGYALGGYNELLLKTALARGWGDILRVMMEYHPKLFIDHFLQEGRTTFSEAYRDSRSVNDMVSDFAHRVILPAMLLEMGYEEKGNVIANGLYSIEGEAYTIARDVLAIEPSYARQLYREKGKFDAEVKDWLQHELMRPHYLSESWHHPTMTLPMTLLSASMDSVWKPLFPGVYKAQNGYTIRALTSTPELRQESEELNHCVGRFSGYNSQCCLGIQHILTIHDAEGKKVSTACVKINKGRIEILEHRGHTNGAPSEEETLAVKELQKTLNIESKEFGETEESKRRTGGHPLIRQIGYIPDWERAQKVFAQYKRHDRRGSLPNQRQDANGHVPRIFMDTIAAPGEQERMMLEGTSPKTFPPVHFIEGDEKLRNMPVREWLRASGALEKIHNAIRKDIPKIAEQRKTVWLKEAAEAPPTMIDKPLDGTKTRIPGTRLLPDGRLTSRHRLGSGHATAQSAYFQ